MRRLDPTAAGRILVRGVNWVGDAVMSLPALAALEAACPQAGIEVLAKPWAAPVYQAAPGRARVRILDAKGEHAGLGGRLRLVGQLRGRGYDWAVLFQNAFEAALLARLAGAPTRLGYSRDGRGLLLSHAIPCTEKVRQVHETAYYLHILHKAGLLEGEPPEAGVRPVLRISQADADWAEEWLAARGLDGPLLGLAPGAAFGPAKCWPSERFAAVARELASEYQAALLFGGAGEAPVCAQTAAGIKGLRALELAGRTSLGQAMALLARLGAFVTNDSGLMHAAAALGTPTTAVFGSTNPRTTAPLGPWVRLVRKPVDCAPCLKQVCPRDMRCFTAIEPREVARAVRELKADSGGGA